jgi:hypothetical protein
MTRLEIVLLLSTTRYEVLDLIEGEKSERAKYTQR